MSKIFLYNNAAFLLTALIRVMKTGLCCVMVNQKERFLGAPESNSVGCSVSMVNLRHFAACRDALGCCLQKASLKSQALKTGSFKFWRLIIVSTDSLAANRIAYLDYSFRTATFP